MSNTLKTTQLRDKLNKKIQSGRKILSVYLTLGYPTLEKSAQIMEAVANAGADIIEIGIPFSDPMADGPTIQHTGQFALDNGTKPADTFPVIEQLRQYTDAEIVIMTYGNIPIQYGLDRFVKEAQDTGVSGVIFPDLPPEHMPDELKSLGPIYLVPPNATLERSLKVASQSNGFVYVVSKLGITGGEFEGDTRLGGIFAEIEKVAPDVPKLQGFGVNGRDAVRSAIEAGADGVIVGSELLRRIGDGGDLEAAVEFVEELREALDS